ncbi:MAG: hypothetical protein A4E20_10840 [Nitrospira sp. SG-bin2]|uniref:phage tail termination protein n=1 Tax=Nitrospira cf. moscoviensis SBR1015 TaxID=96242 RepID=UPI000A0E7CAC|nr:hypothetical protein [Nitrospira cf. moscoviensis SBR1015]OQW34508.1 MAG: hypothetical protein A4E20_10840 [Nitrospira sp. SG-bin2]
MNLPNWFKGGFEDTEDAICDYFEWLLGDSVFVCTWLPPGHYTPTVEPNGGTQPTLRVWRQPGLAEPDLRVDETLIQIASIAETRADAWKLCDFVRSMMDPYVLERFPIPRKDGSVTKFSYSKEWLGPQTIPERIIDEKFIPVTYKLPIRKPRNLPNYRQIINNLLPD